MRALAHRAARFGAIALLAGVGVAAAPTPASASPSAPCEQSSSRQATAHVAVVIDFGGGNVSTACVPIGDGSTGIDLLNARAAQLGVPGPRFNPVNGLLCGIDGYPSTGCAERTANGYAYWSYWNGDSGNWVYSNVGPGSRRMHEGTVEGWRFQSGTGAASDQAPSAGASHSAICPPATTTTTAAPTTTVPPTVATTQPTTAATAPATTVGRGGATSTPGLNGGATTSPTAVGAATTSVSPAGLAPVTDPATGEVLDLPATSNPLGASGPSGGTASGKAGATGTSGGDGSGAWGTSGASGASGRGANKATSSTTPRQGREAAAAASRRAVLSDPATENGSSPVGPLIAIAAIAAAAGAGYWLIARRRARDAAGDGPAPT